MRPRSPGLCVHHVTSSSCVHAAAVYVFREHVCLCLGCMYACVYTVSAVPLGTLVPVCTNHLAASFSSVCVYMWPLCATRVTGALGGGVKFIVNCTTHVVGFNKCVSMT